MPNWKKVIVSGSDAVLNSLNVTNGVTGSLLGTGSWAVRAQSASIADNAVTASRALQANTSSYSTFAATATSASFAPSSETLATVAARGATANNAIVITPTGKTLQLGNAASNGGAGIMFAGASTTKNWFIGNQYNVSNTLEFTPTADTGSTTIGTTPSMVINEGGNVGIGTGVPLETLDVMGTVRSKASEGRFRITSTGGTGREYDFIGGNDSKFYFYDRTAGAYRYVIDANGNVGIGTTTPQNILHVRTGASGLASYDSRYKIILENNGEAYYIVTVPNNSYGGFRMLGTSTEAKAAVEYYMTENLLHMYSTGSARLYTGGNLTMFINTAGNVGIGTTLPVSLLQLYSTSTSPQGITITGGDETFIKFMQGPGVVKNWGFITTNLIIDDFGIYQSNAGGGDPFTAGTARLYFNGSGNVGIGTTNPTQKLEIAGNAIIQNGYNLVIGDTVANPVASTSKAALTLRKFTSGNASTVISASYYIGVGGNEYTNGSYRLIGFGYAEASATTTYPAYIGYIERSTVGYTYGDLIFGTRNTTGASDNPTERMRIQNDGNVGINTTLPADRFVVVGGNNIWTGKFTGTSSSNNSYGINIDAGTSASDTSFLVRNYNGSSVFLEVQGNGSIGIGNSNPGSILHIKGPSAGGDEFGAEVRVWENAYGATLQGSTQGNTAAFIGAFRYNFSNITGSISLYPNAGYGMLFKDGIHIYSSNPGGSGGDAFTPSERFTISSNGSVGIGVVNPTHRLHVSGGYIITKDSTGETAFMQGSTYAYFGNLNAGPAAFGNGDSYTTLIADGGNVGIGTTNMQAKVDLGFWTFSGTNRSLYVRNSAGSINANDYDTMVIQQDDVTSLRMVERNTSTTDQVMAFSIGDNFGRIATSHQPLQFYVSGSPTGVTYQGLGGTLAMHIATDATVGIATSSPKAQLYIFNNKTYSAANINEATASSMAFRIKTRAGSPVEMVMGAYDSTQAGLQAVNTASGAPVGFILNPYGGNVGIGTTIPAVTLQVDASSGGLVRVSRTSAGSGYIQLESDGTNGSLTANNALYFNTAGSTTMVISTTGNVGIGTTNPTQRIEVYSNSGSITFTPSAYGGSYRTSLGCDASAQGHLLLGNNGNNYIQAGTTGTGGILLFYTNCTNAINTTPNGNLAMTLTSGGNVGVGTTVAPAGLTVYNKTSRFWHGGTTYYTSFESDNEINTYDSAGTLAQMFLNWKAGGDVNIARSAIVAKSGGSVGIGTTAPVHQLQVLNNIGLRANSTNFQAIRGTYWGYSTSYPVVMLGHSQSSAFTTVAIGYDPSGNANGAFSGDGREVLFRRGAQFVTPNAADNSFNLYNLVLLDGSVGIGTPSPAGTLDVRGTYYQSTSATQIATMYGDSAGINGLFRIQIDEVNDSFGTGGRTFLGDGGIDIFLGTGNSSYTPANTYIALNHSGEISMGAGSATKHLIINTSGNVGIGTTSPTEILQVSGSIRALQLTTTGISQLIADVDTSATYRAALATFGTSAVGNLIGVSRASNSFVYKDGGMLAIGTGGAYSLVFSTSDTERMRIASGGNVGINTTAPMGGKLHLFAAVQAIEGVASGSAVINSDAYALQIGPRHDRSSTANSYYPGIAFNHLLNYGGGTSYNNSPQAWIGLRLLDTPGSERSYLVFATKPGTSTTGAGNDIPNERMCIEPINGNVGIGTLTPTSILHIADSSANATTLTIGVSGEVPVIKAGGANTDLQIEAVGAGGYLKFVTNGSSRMLIQGGGNVGIGTDTPNYKLRVQGDIYATGDVIAYSDARAKDNVKTVENALTKITSLRGVTYTRNDIEDKSTKLGVIAQEVLKVLPEVVREGTDGYYSVAYGNMAGLFIEAIKELKAQNDTLQSRIQQLESLLLSK